MVCGSMDCGAPVTEPELRVLSLLAEQATGLTITELCAGTGLGLRAMKQILHGHAYDGLVDERSLGWVITSLGDRSIKTGTFKRSANEFRTAQ